MARVKSTLPTYTDNYDPPELLVDTRGRAYVTSGNDLIPVGANRKVASSGNVANASAVASLGAVSAKTNYITGFIITASGATSGLVVDATLAGLAGGTLTFSFAFPAGVLVQATPLVVDFPVPMPASAVNTAITLTLGAGGAGNAHAAVSIMGFDV